MKTNKFKKWFLGLFKTGTPVIEKRRYIEDVKPGESILIEWSRIIGNIGYLKCINNDPKTKRIFLEVTWGNYEKARCKEKEMLLLDYDSKELQNFHLLNQYRYVEQSDDIATLKKKLKEAIKNEEYEKASELQKKINNILKSK